jgi:amidase
MSELHYLGLVELGERIKKRELSAVEATQAQLERIHALDGQLKSYAAVASEQALEAARKADQEIAKGKHKGPLHGVPVAVKDLAHTKGIPTTAGMPIHKNFLAQHDATVVARLKEAGAILLGKTQMTEGAFSAHHPDIPSPVNPWGAQYWTGVSSSGSGVATAAGLCYGSLGTDTLGSIRFPSTMNNLSGLKPTWGRVSRYGIFPLAETMDHVGPMTRSAKDSAAMLQAIAGEDPEDRTALLVPVPDYLKTIEDGVKGLRIGIDRRMIEANADEDFQRVTAEAAKQFKRLGAKVTDIAFPPTDPIVRDAVQLCATEAAAAHADTYPARAKEYGPVLSGLLDLGRSANGVTIALILARRSAFAGQVAALFNEVDLLLMPAMHEAAPTMAQLYERRNDLQARYQRIRFTCPLNMSGSPSLTLPGGKTKQGMPVGVQLVGRHLDEATILRAGHAYQRETDWHRRRPPVA